MPVGAIFVLCVFLAGCGAGGQAGTPNPPQGTLAFAAPTSLDSGFAFPTTVIVADFNGDGRPDIAISSGDSSSVAIFLNDGNGGFLNPLLVSVQNVTGIEAMAVGDFNEDGRSDLIISPNSFEAAAVVLLGNGDGTFVQLPPIANSTGFSQARIADLNGDRHQDLVLLDGGSTLIFLGRGDGTFTLSDTVFALPGGPAMEIVVGDFNGDGEPDIVGIEKIGSLFGQNLLLFYAGNGDGTFQDLVTTDVPVTGLNSIAAGDFNGDGKQDLLLGTFSEAYIALGNGDGSFQASSSELILVDGFSASSSDFGIQLGVADFDLDGRPDTVLANTFDGTVAILLNSPQGFSLTTPGKLFTFSVAPGIHSIGVGDLNGDGIPDVVISSDGSNQVSIILSQRK